MRTKKKKQTSKNLKIALGFFVLVAILIIGSLTLRFISLIQSSKFDGRHRFTIVLLNAKPGAKVISFAPDNKSISILQIKNSSLSNSSQVGKFFKIPIDGDIGTKQYLRDEKVSAQIKSLLFHYGKLKTHLTVIDLIRLWIFSKNVPEHAIEVDDLSTLGPGLPSDLVVDKLSNRLFSDYTISQERQSIQIINGTGVLGLGNQLGRLIANLGADVVAVNTSEKILENSKISYFGTVSYTLWKLQNVLGFKTVTQKERGISDIIIELGKDSLNNLRF